MTTAIPEFRQQTCAALISAGVTQHAQIISTVAALEKFVFNLDEYAAKTSEPEVKNAVAEKTTTTKKTVAAVEAQKATDESAEKVAETSADEQVQEKAATETNTEKTVSVTVTKDEVQKALIGLGKVHGRTAIASILEQVGAANMSAVAEADYPKIMQLVEGYAA